MQPFSTVLLDWYDVHKRMLPWRTYPPNPYWVWISEVMLQQTRVSSVESYFHAFLMRFPSVQHLAEASLDDLLWCWQGLGYYRRAVHLHRAAQWVNDHGFPTTKEGWLALPGIGEYTASAIMAIAWEQPTVAVDGNIKRIMSRYGGFAGPGWEKKVAELAVAFFPFARYGDYTQALMDLGAQICRPKSPFCSSCPLAEGCCAWITHTVKDFPPKTARVQKKLYGQAWVFLNSEGALYITKHFSHSLLQGLWGFPTTSWEAKPLSFPSSEDWYHHGTILHGFTHIDLTMEVFSKKVASMSVFWNGTPLNGSWVLPSKLHAYALSRLMRKVQILFQKTYS